MPLLAPLVYVPTYAVQSAPDAEPHASVIATNDHWKNPKTRLSFAAARNRRSLCIGTYRALGVSRDQDDLVTEEAGHEPRHSGQQSVEHPHRQVFRRQAQNQLDRHDGQTFLKNLVSVFTQKTARSPAREEAHMGAVQDAALG